MPRSTRSTSVKSLNSRAAAHLSWAKTENPSARTAPARAKFDARFDRQADPDGSLPPAERHRRAEQLRKAYFAQLAAKSAAARAAR